MSSEGAAAIKSSITLVAIAITGIALACLSSFRLGVGEIDLAWHVNLEKVALAAAVGIAFTSTGALFHDTRLHIKLQVVGFVTLNVALAVMLIGTLLQWALLLSLAATIISGITTCLLVNRATHYSKNLNLWCIAILASAFGLSVFNFLAASALNTGLRDFVYWLQGYLVDANGYGFIVLLTSLSLFLWMLTAKHKQVPFSLLLGLGVGIAGPVFFIAGLTPIVIRRIAGAHDEKLFLITCASIGALTVVLADSVPRLLVGGYAPSLAIPIGLVSIPILLYYQRQTLLHDFPSKLRTTFEASFILLWLLVFLFVLYHAVQFADQAA